MATGGVGNLTVFLGLNAAQFDDGLSKAQAKAFNFGYAIGETIRNGAQVAGAAISALASAGAATFAVLAKQAENVAAYQGFADKMGESAANVTKLKLAADLSSTSLANVASASVGLSGALSGSDEKARKAAAGLAAIGLSAADIKNKSPVDQLQAIADKMAGFADGAEKSAVATALFGAAGGEMVGMLKEMGEQGEQQIALTEDQISTADAYSKVIARNKSDLSTMAQIVAAESVPAVAALTGALTDTVKEMLGLNGQTTALANNAGIRDFAGNAAIFLAQVADMVLGVVTRIRVLGQTIGGLAAAAAAVMRGEFSEAKGIVTAMRADNAALLATLDGPSIADRVRERLANPLPPSTQGATKPRINTSGLGMTKKGAGGGDLLKKQLDNDLKILENARKQEADILADRNKMLDLYNSENLISFHDYFEGRRAALAESVKAQSDLYDQEIARLQQYQAQQAKASEREAAQGKINDLLEKKMKLQRDAGMQGIVLGSQENKAYLELQRTLQGVNASILELLGNSAAAARLRFDATNEDLRKRLKANNDTDGLAALNKLRQLTVSQADYNQQQEESSRITARLQIEEDRINVARNVGAMGELGGLLKVAEARRAAVVQLEAQVQAMEAIARASENPRLLLQAEQARAALESLRAQTDLLAQKFDTIFSDSASNAFADFITGTKSAKDAFNSFISDAVSQVTRLVSNQLFTQLLGGGTGNSVGSWLSSLFGGGRAVGGSISPGRFYEVNENGPELYQQGGRSYLMTGGKAATIKPLAANGAGVRGNHSTTFVLPDRIDRQTQNQIAQENRRQLERSRRLSA